MPHLRSVPDLIDAIESYLAQHNDNRQPSQWTAFAEPYPHEVSLRTNTPDAISD